MLVYERVTHLSSFIIMCHHCTYHHNLSCCQNPKDVCSIQFVLLFRHFFREPFAVCVFAFAEFMCLQSTFSSFRGKLLKRIPCVLLSETHTETCVATCSLQTPVSPTLKQYIQTIWYTMIYLSPEDEWKHWLYAVILTLSFQDLGFWFLGFRVLGFVVLESKKN